MPPPTPHTGRRRPLKVFVQLVFAYAYCRDILRGFSAYHPTTGTWRPYIGEIGNPDGSDLRRNVPGKADALIAMLSNAAMQETAATMDVPVVNVSSATPVQKVPAVLSDNARIGRLGAMHLMELGLRRLVFIGPSADLQFAEDRAGGFRAAAGEARAECICHTGPTDQVGRFLRKLAPPLGVMAASDHHALQVSRACEDVGLGIPEDVALLGADNDETICSVAHPSLTSVDPGAERIGFEAARLLDRLLGGADPPAGPLLLQPRGPVVRASTDTVAVRDAELARAVRFIRQHACEGLQVPDAAEAAAMSRRTLERRFRRRFGHSVHTEIRRIQLRRATELLVQTDMAIPDVAGACGFQYATRFSASFKARFGMPPTAYRAQFRLR